MNKEGWKTLIIAVSLIVALGYTTLVVLMLERPTHYTCFSDDERKDYYGHTTNLDYINGKYILNGDVGWSRGWTIILTTSSRERTIVSPYGGPKIEIEFERDIDITAATMHLDKSCTRW